MDFIDKQLQLIKESRKELDEYILRLEVQEQRNKLFMDFIRVLPKIKKNNQNLSIQQLFNLFIEGVGKGEPLVLPKIDNVQSMP
mgnify:CR=1 FL=1